MIARRRISPTTRRLPTSTSHALGSWNAGGCGGMIQRSNTTTTRPRQPRGGGYVVSESASGPWLQNQPMREPISAELKAAYLQVWKIIDAYADATATADRKEALLRQTVAEFGAAETAGALGFLAGSVLLSGIARLQGRSLDEVRRDWGERLPDVL